VNITLENTGKRFRKQWIFRGIDQSFSAGDVVALTGSNGSGKSTLLQVLAGLLTPSEGRILWSLDARILPDQIFRHVSWCAPSIALYEDYTLSEAVAFHAGFRPFRNSIQRSEIPSLIGLENHQSKQLAQFSSGMKQRVKLGLAILSDSPLLLLDEPTSHLDTQGIDWFQKLLSEHLDNRLTWIASNRVTSETVHCTRALDVMDYKTSRK
jgi:ABC-type multidrug transport system ATPase subunit